jgi:uncharacterized protein (TIGR03437 family)
MKTRGIVGLFLLLFIAVFAIFSSTPAQPRHQEVSHTPYGPFHVEGSRIIDSHGHAFLMRGTQLTDFHPQTAAKDAFSDDNYFGPHSATSMSGMRLRFNMNTVRVAVDPRESGHPEFYPRLEELIRRANFGELLVVVAMKDPSAEFLKEAAERLKQYSNVMLDLAAADAGPLLAVLRKDEFNQPVIVDATERLADPNVIYAVAPGWGSHKNETDWESKFGRLASRVPMFATGMNLGLDNPETCRALPSDPADVQRMIDWTLGFYDQRHISWVASEYRPGELIGESYIQHPTTLEHGWDCSKPEPTWGPGRVIEAHLRSTWERGLFAVSTAGGPDLARGSIAIAYGPVMATRDTESSMHPQTSLGGMKVEIRDARGTTHFAQIIWTSEGWGQINYIVPEDAATGPATMTLVRDDNSRLVSYITITDVAPGFWTPVTDRGAVRGVATQTFADGRKIETETARRDGLNGFSLPIPVSADSVTTVRLAANGVRNAKSTDEIEVLISGVRVPVLAFGAENAPGMDYVVVQIPQSLRNIGATDLIARAHGRVSNALRIRIGQTS